MVIDQYNVYWIDLNPTLGSEVNKVRPCVVLSPDEMNHNIKTIIIAPVTSTIRPYPSRVFCEIEGKRGAIMIDQIRTIDKQRIKSLIGKLPEAERQKIREVINSMLC